MPLFTSKQTTASPSPKHRASAFEHRVSTMSFDPEIQSRIEQVSEKFNEFISRQKNEIVQAKEEYLHTVSQLQSEHKELILKVKECEDREKELGHQLSKEAGDVQGSQSRITELNLRHRQLLEDKRQLESQVEELQGKVVSKREELSKLKQAKSRQSDLDLPETLIYEQLLGFKIEGLKDNLLRFVFENVNSQDPKRQCSLDLNVSNHLYAIERVEPQLPKDKLDALLDSFNESRDLTQFLKHTRQCFKESTQP